MSIARPISFTKMATVKNMAAIILTTILMWYLQKSRLKKEMTILVSPTTWNFVIIIFKYGTWNNFTLTF